MILTKIGKLSRILAVLVGLVWVLFPRPAEAFITGEEYKIAAFCKNPSVRRTVIYIDDALMIEDDVAWAERLHGKLMANLMPAEPLTVVRLDTRTGRAEEIWNGCFPDYTPAQLKKIEESGPYFLRANPVEIVEKQRQVFSSQMVNALAKIFEGAKRPTNAVRFLAQKAPQRRIVRALAADEARFSLRDKTTRVILYTDGLENSNLFSVFSSEGVAQKGRTAASTLGLNLGKAVFYVFGVASTLKNAPETSNVAKIFWRNFFAEANALLAGFGSDINVSTSRPISRKVLDFDVTIKGKTGVGRMVLMPDTDGTLQDSFISLSAMRSGLLEGSYKCAAEASCVLDARILSPFLTNVAGEEIQLFGNCKTLAGKLRVPNAYLEDNPKQKAEVELSARLTPGC